MRALEKHVMLTVLDQSWKEHGAHGLPAPGIYLRGYAQKQPKQEYKKEAFELFSDMLENVKREVVTLLSRVRIRSDEEVQALEAAERQQAEARLSQSQFQHGTWAATAPTRKPRRCRLPSRAWRRCSATSRRSAATIRARAAVARSTSTATAS